MGSESPDTRQDDAWLNHLTQPHLINAAQHVPPFHAGAACSICLLQRLLGFQFHAVRREISERLPRLRSQAHCHYTIRCRYVHSQVAQKEKVCKSSTTSVSLGITDLRGRSRCCKSDHLRTGISPGNSPRSTVETGLPMFVGTAIPSFS